MSLGRILDDLEFRLAAEPDRDQIYAMRHEVYARELRQHPVNSEGRLRDALDEFNEYIVAAEGPKVAGFVSVTPPWGTSYSVDKYVRREDCPFSFDDGLFEIRILTVQKADRLSALGPLLMFAALRLVDSWGGRRMVAIGRAELRDLYLKAGFEPLGHTVKSGALTFELMTASITEMQRHVLASYGAALASLEGRIRWSLGVPYWPGARTVCEHGGASMDSIGRDFRDLDRRGASIAADVLDAWFPPSPEALAAIRDDPGWVARTSPPAEGEGLVGAIASARSVPPSRVVLGAGSSDLIFRSFRQWLSPGSRVLLPDPAYGEYEHVLRAVIGCRVDRLRLSPDDGYRLDPEALRRALSRGYDLVVVVNPDNPGGGHVPREVLRMALSTAPPRTRVWIDEAYVEYAGEAETLEAFAVSTANVVICKSLSKAYALSGLRVAYLVAPERDAVALRRWTPPWAVSLPAQIAAVRALEDTGYYRGRWEETRRLRSELAAALRLGGHLDVHESAANFLLATLHRGGPTAAEVVAQCRARGLYLRDLTGSSDVFEARTFRVAVKEAHVQTRIVAILHEVLDATSVHRH